MIQTKTLAERIIVIPSSTRKNIRNLISKGFITVNGVLKNRTITLTESGRKESI